MIIVDGGRLEMGNLGSGGCIACMFWLEQGLYYLVSEILICVTS